jgi:NitT/TauT family transport system permease protein
LSIVQTEAASGGAVRANLTRWGRTGGKKAFDFFAGLAILGVLWWLGVWLITLDPDTPFFFEQFGPQAALFEGLPKLWAYGTLQESISASGYRLGMGLLLSMVVGVPLGIIIGLHRLAAETTHVPFQILRMTSPLSWEPIAVIALATWNQAVIFLIFIGAVWPIIFATAAGVAKIDPSWRKVARNLGAKPWQMLTSVIWPAIAYDVMTGLRLAVGIAWIVVIPAEFFGTNSGIGYTLQNARENLFYDELMGMIVIIGCVGYVMDAVLVKLQKRTSWVRED